LVSAKFFKKSQEALQDGHFLNFAVVDITPGAAYLPQNGLRRRGICQGITKVVVMMAGAKG
jgi:hypothetical protein